MDICSDLNFLRVIYFVKGSLIIVRVLAPLILIGMASLDLYKIVIKAGEKPAKTILNRFIAAFFVFFVPTFINVVLNSLGQADIGDSVCWINANENNITLLAKQHEIELEALKNAEKKRNEELKAQREAYEKDYEAAKKRAQEIAANNNVNENSSNYDDVMNSNFLENGKDGKVVVENGIFYTPNTYTSGTDGTKGSGPYGYNIYFYKRLLKFTEAAAQQGYKISISTSSYGAWRSIDIQRYYWNCYQTKSCNGGNLAATPGKSNHGWGVASDLAFSSISAKYWAHDNARKYGLSFPLCKNVRVSSNCTEDWHIEPASVQKRAGLK